MHSCNSLRKVLSVLIFTAGAGLYAQTVPTVTSPTAPTVSSPEMPVITSPTIGSGFYMPGSNSSSYSNTSETKTTDTKTSTEETVSETKKTVSTDSIKSSLSASDISTLDQLGILNQVANSFGKNSNSLTSSLSKISNLYTSDSNSETNIKLQQVLTELEQLKAQNDSLQKQLEDVKNNSSGSQIQNQTTTVIETIRGPQPKVLRFYVNGYSVLATCRTIYISSTQNDGSFLLTGDRIYLSDGKNRKETFYIYFKPNEASNGISSYSIACAVGQDYLNQYSFLYQMSQRENLTAYRTGNLVTLRTTDPSWQLEFLLDLGN